jgi:hypothetical protein
MVVVQMVEIVAVSQGSLIEEAFRKKMAFRSFIELERTMGTSIGNLA